MPRLLGGGWDSACMGKADGSVLIVGASVRGLAESATTAGVGVLAVDAYGDLDLLARAPTIALRRDLGVDWSPAAAVAAAAGLACSSVAYVSNLDNHPQCVARLAAGRRLLGNPPDVVRRVRDPVRLARELARRGLAAPRVRTEAPARATGGRTWLLKPRRSGGGHGVRAWRPGERVSRNAYLQERVEGIPGSITFVADGRRAVPLGLSRQLVGDPMFGGSGFRYCGSLLCSGPEPLFPRETELATAAEALAAAVTEAFGLTGVNGIDFVARDGVPWPIEVNPRYTASMELVERVHGISVFHLHAEGCGGRLPASGPLVRPAAGVAGKAIVYARGEVTMAHLRRWWTDANVRDVPHPGERITDGQPICTVFGDAASETACREALAARAAVVYAAVQAERAA
jgi:predicted ATP-grasp superfamily ATP-dependent carboligase